MKTSMTNNLWGVLFGVITTLVLALVLCALGAALLGSGALPISAAGIYAWVVTVLASFFGALICAKKAGEKRLPLCLLSGGIYLLLVFVLRGLIFGDVAPRPWIVPLCVLGGSVLGAVLSSKQKRRKY